MENTSNDKPNKPSNSAFKQQRLKGWRCTPSALSLGFIYLGLGMIFIMIGSLILSESSKVFEIDKRYDDIDECKADWRTPHTCIISIKITEDLEAPIFFYYEIKNMFQNHRKYNKSRDIFQLMGELQSVDEIDTYCDPIVDMEDLGFFTTLDLKNSDPANPCGLVAKSYFNDTFSLVAPGGFDEVPMTSKGIAWSIDKEEKFKKSPDSEDLQWIDVENGMR
jgi:hypothetical protein